MNIVLWIDDGIGEGDTFRVLDYLVFDWKWGKPLREQSEYYKKFFKRLMDFKKSDKSWIETSKEYYN